MAFDEPLLLHFLRDGVSGNPTRVSASAASLLHQRDLKLGGLKLNREKSMLEAMQVGQWTDIIKIHFRVSPKKIAKLKSSLHDFFWERYS